MSVPTCTNCGGALATSLYCEACLRRDDETWFDWRGRLARVRATGVYSEPRECPCGKSHLSRALYWEHRLERERVS